MPVKLQNLEICLPRNCCFIREDMKHSTLFQFVLSSQGMCGTRLRHVECKLFAGTMILGFFLGKAGSTALTETINRAQLGEHLPLLWVSSLLCCLERSEENNYIEEMNDITIGKRQKFVTSRSLLFKMSHFLRSPLQRK